MPSLSTLRTYVRYRLGNRPDLTGDTGLVMMNEWVNAAIREIAHTHRFDIYERVDSSLVTSASLRYVTPPSDVYAVLSIFDATNLYQLAPFPGDWQDFERETASGIKGKPTNWIREGGNIYFKDAPDAAYSLRCLFKINPAYLTNDTDVPELPVVWHDAVKILAVSKGWHDIGDSSRANEAEQEYRDFTMKIRTPKAIERTVAARRGAHVQQWIRNPRTGV